MPFPGDLLVGAYFPWLEEKWGYVVGVPVKNPLISDVFSQFYIWKQLIGEAYRSGQFPLWNPYSYSGYPLLANFHSGALYPLNILFMILDMKVAWTWFVLAQMIGCPLFMYWYLKKISISTAGSIIGAVTYSFSGFALSWSQFATAGQTMIWLPMALWLVEKFVETKRWKYLFYLSPAIFLIITSGHFQAAIYSAIILVSYLLYRLLSLRSLRKPILFVWIMIFGLLAVGMAATQILPTLELTKLGIRFGENYIASANNGLVPITNIITLFAPDFFGNPATGNFWGVFNYHETIYYTGVIGLFALLVAFKDWKKLGVVKYFFIAAIISGLMGLDGAMGRLVYRLDVPGLSTSAAGRIAFVYTFAMAVITAKSVDLLKGISTKELIKRLIVAFDLILLVWIIVYGVKISPPYISDAVANWNKYIHIAQRNLILPTALFVAFASTLLVRRWRIWVVLIGLLITADLFRFGWKYIPFVPKLMAFPEVPAISAMLKDNDVFRVERERAEIFTPNTWSAYHLMSPSGYDPMAIADYVVNYEKEINDNPNSNLSRYSELSKYDAERMGNFNVKYFMVLKRDEKAKIPGDIIDYRINQSDWNRIFDSKTVAVLENKKYQPRARLLDEKGEIAEGLAQIVKYSPNEVVINYSSESANKLLLTDSWYPGWKASVNGKTVEISNEIKPFRTVIINPGKGEVRFTYFPESFKLGLIISVCSSVTWLTVLYWARSKKVSMLEEVD